MIQCSDRIDLLYTKLINGENEGRKKEMRKMWFQTQEEIAFHLQETKNLTFASV